MTTPTITRRRRRNRWLGAGAAGALVASLVGLGDVTRAEGHLTLIVDGLDNPRGIDVGPGGRIYVAEAGRGGDTIVEDVVLGTGPADVCVGTTGRVSQIHRGQRTTLINLPSISDADPEGSCSGFAAVGPHGVAVTGAGELTVTIGLGAPPASRALLGEALPAAGVLGTAHRILPNGRNQQLGDLAAFEQVINPENPDSNAYGVAIVPGGRLVADAGGNTLVRLNANGSSSLVAAFAPQCVPWLLEDLIGFPNPIREDFNPCGTQAEFPAEAVPTAVAVGPDGAYYVSELGGFPFTPGTARVWRVDPHRSTPAVCSTFAFIPNDGCSVYAHGLTSVVDLAFGSDGSLYTVQFADAGVFAAEIFGDFEGSVQKVAPGGGPPVASIGGLMVPGGIAIDGGHAYVTNFSIFPDAGQVVRAALP